MLRARADRVVLVKYSFIRAGVKEKSLRGSKFVELMELLRRSGAKMEVCRRVSAGRGVNGRCSRVFVCMNGRL